MYQENTSHNTVMVHNTTNKNQRMNIRWSKWQPTPGTTTDTSEMTEFLPVAYPPLPHNLDGKQSRSNGTTPEKGKRPQDKIVDLTTTEGEESTLAKNLHESMKAVEGHIGNGSTTTRKQPDNPDYENSALRVMGPQG